MQRAWAPGFAALLLASVAAAQPSPPPTSNVTSFPASFFAQARPTTAMDMIARLPGFVFDSGAQVRGFGGAAGNVLIDGQRPTTKQDDLEGILRRIPASQVVRIEVIRGAIPGVDMQGKSLIANIVRKGDLTQQTTLFAADDFTPSTGGQLPGFRLDSSQKLGASSLEASIGGSRFRDDGAGSGHETYSFNPAFNPNAPCTPSCTERLSARAGGWQDSGSIAYAAPMFGGRFKVNLTGTGTVYSDREGDAGAVAAETSTLNDTNRDAAVELGLNYQHRLGSQTELELIALQQVHQSKDDDTYTANGLVETFNDFNRLSETILRAILRRPFTPTFNLTVDGEGAYNLQRTGSNYVVGGVVTPVVAGDIRVDEIRLEGGATLAWTASPTLNLEAALRYESSTITSSGDVSAQKTFGYLKPRLAVTWTPVRNDQLRLRLERSVGQLDFNAFVASGQLNTGLHAGNPALLPQTEDTAELAYQHSFWRAGAVTLTYAHSEIGAVVDRIRGFDPSDPTNASAYYDTPGNLGSAQKDEIITDLTLPLDRLGDRGGLFKTTLDWRHIPVVDPVTGKTRPQSEVRPFRGNVHLSQDFTKQRVSMGLDIGLAASQAYYRFNEIDVYKFGTYCSFFAEYKPTENLSLRFEVDNFSNRQVRREYTYFIASRPSPVQSTDLREQYTGPLLHFRVRQVY